VALLLPRFTANETSKRVDKAVQAGEAVQAGSSGDDYLRRRGVPILSYGVGGAMLYSRPERQVLRLDRQRLG
jgi:hypothetical protein